MKKKLTAILLTLCLVLGMLPMSALAAWYYGDKEVTFSGGVGTDADGNKYYVTSSEHTEGVDTLDYYDNYALTGPSVGQLIWKPDAKVVTGVSITGTAKVGETLTANVTPADATVTYQWKAGGTDIAGATGKTYKLTENEVGKTITVTVTGTGSYKGTAISAATSAVAAADTPVEKTYAISTNITGQGTVTTNPADKAAEGVNVTVKATPAEKWKLTSLKANDQDISENYQFTMPAKDVTIIAVFETALTTVPVEATVDEKTGKATADVDLSDVTVAEGSDQVQIAVTLPEGTNVAGVKEVEVKLPADTKNLGVSEVAVSTPVGTVTLTPDQITSETTLTVSKDTTTVEGVTGALDTVKVALTNADGAIETEVQVSVPTKAQDGATFYFAYQDEDGTWKTFKATVSNEQIRSDVPVPANQQLFVMTEQQAEDAGAVEKPDETKFNVKVTQAKNGNVAANKTKAKPGDSVKITATPNSGYYVVSITVDDVAYKGSDLKDGDSNKYYELTMPSHDVNVTAAFAKKSTGPSGGGGGGGGGAGINHSVNTGVTKNGSVRVSPSSAAKGEKVTVTVRPNDGYVLDTLTIKDANGKEITLTKVNDTTYTFIMPETSVSVDATFKAADSGTEETKGFSDVAKDYTFYADITWVADKGYMQGYSDGTFRPTANTTRQALWMVLARIDGANPSDMSAARAWAMASKISDGTNPGNAMSRQQMVTMLYRYAQLKGYKLDGGKSLDTFSDAGSVADYAKDAMSWAVGNGIVQGTGSNALNPEGPATRAHFAAFLHRFCQTAGIA